MFVDFFAFCPYHQCQFIFFIVVEIVESSGSIQMLPLFQVLLLIFVTVLTNSESDCDSDSRWKCIKH